MSRDVWTTYDLEKNETEYHIDGKVYSDSSPTMTENEWQMRKKIEELEKEVKNRHW